MRKRIFIVTDAVEYGVEIKPWDVIPFFENGVTLKNQTIVCKEKISFATLRDVHIYGCKIYVVGAASFDDYFSLIGPANCVIKNNEFIGVETYVLRVGDLLI